MNLFKKLMGDDDMADDTNDSDVNPGTFQDPEQPDDYSRPKAQFVLVKPNSRNELPTIADSLLDRKSVIVNLELVSNEARRYVDFLTGVSYALHGKTKKISGNTYLIIPGGLEVSGDVFEDIENDLGFFE